MSSTGAHAPASAAKAARAAFLRKYPEFAGTGRIDTLRASDYRRLEGQTYLDYTGGGLYGESQVRLHGDLLNHQVFSNPHSHNATSAATTDLVERARQYVLRYVNAPAGEYVAVFTPNATGALKHVGESYTFAEDGRFLLTVDNHNSVNGIREFAHARGARVDYAPLTVRDLRIDLPRLDALLDQADRSRPNSRHLAYLRRSGLVETRREGLWIHYRLGQLADPVLAVIGDAVRHALTHIDIVHRDAERLSKRTGCCVPTPGDPAGASCCGPRATQIGVGR